MVLGPTSRHGFTLVELVIVVVIIGVITAIAIPRMAGASENSRIASVKASLKILDTAVEMYAAEHDGLLPSDGVDRIKDTDGVAFVKRLLRPTAQTGAFVNPQFGPYLRDMPANPYNGLSTVRIDGDAAGKNTDGWRFDTGRRRFQADDPIGKDIRHEQALAGVSIGDSHLEPADLGATAIGPD